MATSRPGDGKRVVHMTSVHHPFDTRIFYKEIRTLATNGYDVTFIAPHDHDECVDGVRIRAVPPVSGKLRRVMGMGWRLIRTALQEPAELYHIHDPELLLWAQILRLRGRTVIYDMHENVPQDLKHKAWIDPRLRKTLSALYQLMERLLLQGMPVIFAEDSYGPHYQWHRGPHETVLNMPLANQLLAIHKEPNPHPALGYIGDVKPWRGSTVTLEALAILKSQGREIVWECVGQLTDVQRQSMEQFIHQHGLNKVNLHDRLKPDVWHPIIARCHIGLAVLESLPNHVNSYPTKLFEYMALGVPVIASGFPLYKEIVEGVGCGLTVNDPNDPQELADCIVQLLDNPEEARAMGQRGREAVRKHYRWDVEAHKLLKFYANLLDIQS